MKTMSGLPNYFEFLDLQKIQQVLRDKHGSDSPSYATLRRWASDGKLISAEKQHGDPKRRALYAVPEVERIWLSSGRAKKSIAVKKRAAMSEVVSFNQALKEAPSGAEAQLLAINSKMDTLFDSVASLLTKVREQDEILRTCVSSTASLAAVRAMLMNKYDAADALKNQVIDQLRARLKDAEKISDIDRISMKLGIQLGTLSAKVSELHSLACTDSAS